MLQNDSDNAAYAKTLFVCCVAASTAATITAYVIVVAGKSEEFPLDQFCIFGFSTSV